MSHEFHMPSREEILAGTSRPLPARLRTLCTVLAIVGALVFVIGLFVAPERAWRSLLFNWLYFTSVSSAGVTFVAVQRITTARWSRPVIRFLEGYVAFLPVAFVLLLLIFVGRGHIFPWAAASPEIAEKRLYLNPWFLIPRDIIIFGTITALSVWYIYTSVRLDVGVSAEGGAKWAKGIREKMRRGFRDERREIHSTHSLQGKIAVFLAFAFAYFWIVLSWDLSMSLDLHFQSTMYGWWFFMGSWVTALASFTILTIAWRRYLDRYDLITEKHFHDLGKLCFAFTAFWGYLTFGQYLVIWYGNVPLETRFFLNRFFNPPWGHIAWAIFVVGWLVPFAYFLRRLTGRPPTRHKVFTVILFMGWIAIFVERILIIFPSIDKNIAFPLGIREVFITAGFFALFVLSRRRFLARYQPLLRQPK